MKERLKCCMCQHVFETSTFTRATNSQNIGEKEAKCPKCGVLLICWQERTKEELSE